MHIDARAIDLKELLRKLKDILTTKISCEVDIEIIFTLEADIQKVKTFVEMSGCKAEVAKNDKSYIMHIKGSPCCV